MLRIISKIRSMVLPIVAIWTTCFISSTRAADAPDELSSQIEDTLTKRAIDAIAPFIPIGSFTVSAHVKVKAPLKAQPSASIYLRGVTQPRDGVDLNKSAMEKIIANATLDIGLPPKLSKAQQDEISEILRSRLPSSVSITFKKTKLFKTDDSQEKNQILLRAENELQGVKSRMEDIKKERDDVKLEAQLAKTEIDKLARENSTLKIKAPPKQTMKETIQSQIGTIIGYVLIFASLIVLGVGVINVARSHGTSMQSLAVAIQNAASNLANSRTSAKGGQDTDLATSETTQGQGGQNQQSANNQPFTNQSSTYTQLSAGISERIVELKKELSNLVANETIPLARQFISDLLMKDGSIGKAVLVFELLGREKAAHIFQLLSQENQIQITGFVRSGVYPANKFELMIQAGEEFKTKLVVENLKLPELPETGEIFQTLKTLSATDLYKVFSNTEQDALPRLLSIMDSKTTSDVLTKLRQDNPEKFNQCIQSLTLLPEAKFSPEHAQKYDPVIFQSIKKLASDSRVEIFKPFLKHYEEILEGIPADILDEVFQKLEHEPALNAHLRDNVITLSTLFKVNSTQMQEILSAFSTKELAALVFGLNPKEQEIVAMQFDNVRRDIIKEELDRLNSRGKSKADKAFKAVKTKIIATLKAFKVAGELQVATESNAESGQNIEPSSPPLDAESKQRVA